MRKGKTALCLLFFLCAFHSYGQEGEHNISLRGDFGAVHETSSELFDSTMNGIAGGKLSVQFPVAKDFFIGVGGNLSFYEQAEAPATLLDEQMTMYSYGPFLHLGYQPYLSEIFFLELSVRSGYRAMVFDSPVCEREGRKRIHKQNAFYYSPSLGLWWDTGDGLKIGANVSHRITQAHFDPDLVCNPSLQSDPSASGNYRAWEFGFSFVVDLVRE